MAAIIVSRFGNKRAKLAGNLMVRSISLPANWSIVRVGILATCTDGANFTSNMGFGLCSGTTNCFGDPTVGHFFGVATYGARTFSGNQFSSIDFQTTKKVNTTQSVSANICADATLYGSGQTNNIHGAMFLNIRKLGAPNYGINMFYCNNVAGTTPMTSDQFLGQMGLYSPTQTGYGWGSERSLAVDEGADGTLNAVQVFWGDTTVPIEVLDLAYAVIATA